MEIKFLPTPHRCQGECGNGEVCHELTSTSGYCLQPAKRAMALLKRLEKWAYGSGPNTLAGKDDL